MNRRKLIFIGIFVVSLLLGLTGIALYFVLNAHHTQAPQANTTTQIPSFTSYALTCTSTGSNNSLSVLWIAPSSIPSTYTVSGTITDTSTQTQPITFGPLPIGQGSYIFSSANGLDTYSASLWIQDTNQNKSTTVTTGQVNSSLCTAGTQPTPTPAPAGQTATPTPTPSLTPTPTVVTAATSTPTSTPTPKATSGLSCNSFSITQNGTTVANNTVTAGSGDVTFTPGISTTASGSVVYSSAQWSINPSTPVLTVSSDNSNATWTPPATISGTTSYTISLSDVSDASNDTLSSPCTAIITVSSGTGTLPNTADSLPTTILVGLGILCTLIGGIFFFKKQTIEE